MKTEKPHIDQKLILRSMALLIGGLVVLASLFYMVHTQRETDSRIFSGPFTVYDGDERADSVGLDEYSIDHTVKRGEVFVVQGTLPDNLPEAATLSVLTYLSTVDVSVNGRACYTYGHDLYKAGDIVGSGYHYVNLPDNSAGKPFVVEITAGERNAFTSIPVFHLTSADRQFPDFAGKNFFNLLIGIFMIVLGMISAGISLGLVFKRRRYRRLIYIGMFVLLLGIWILCNTKTMQIFSTNLRFNTILEYASLYMAVIPIFCLIRFMRNDAEPWKKYLMDAIVVFTNVFAVCTIVGQASGIYHISNWLLGFHFECGAALIVYIFTALKPVREMTASERLMNIAILIMCVFAGADLVRFNVQKYIMANEASLDMSFLPLASLVFTVLLFMSNLYYFYEIFTRQARADSLEKAAYEDPVTGLYNRAYSEKRFKELSKKKTPFLLINMDLNGLKKTNDTYGHEVGDRLIFRFATALSEGFSDIGETYRMGGDEFMVLVAEPDMKKVREAFQKLFERTEAYSYGLPTKLSFAYGMAASGQFEDVPEEHEGKRAELVYQLADQKMYAMKQAQKNTSQSV